MGEMRVTQNYINIYYILIGFVVAEKMTQGGVLTNGS